MFPSLVDGLSLPCQRLKLAFVGLRLNGVVECLVELSYPLGLRIDQSTPLARRVKSIGMIGAPDDDSQGNFGGLGDKQSELLSDIWTFTSKVAPLYPLSSG